VILAWTMVLVIVASTTVADILQSLEMKKFGLVEDFRPSGIKENLLNMARRPYLLWAIFCMAVSFFSFMFLLSIADLSFAVPATAGSYVVETILARVILREHINGLRWAGALLVAGGVAMLV
jgi:drug/metabolite transporter (DMT)-like permease